MQRRSRQKRTPKWYEKLDFSDRREFANAERGWLDNAEGKIIYAEDGKFAWDLQSYGDLNRDAPDTVNPSLWRNTQLNAKAGLFEVCDGIYQVRGLIWPMRPSSAPTTAGSFLMS